MKVKLLNDGGYGYMIGVNFPVICEAARDIDGADAVILGSTLQDLGADKEAFTSDEMFLFIEPSEVTLVEE